MELPEDLIEASSDMWNSQSVAQASSNMCQFYGSICYISQYSVLSEECVDGEHDVRDRHHVTIIHI